MVERRFAPDEEFAFAGIDPSLAALRVAELWNLKESYLKARALGRTLTLNCCSLTLTRGGIAMILDERPGDVADRWHFAQSHTTSGHVPTLYAAASGALRVSVVARRFVPLALDEAIELPIVRASWVPVAGRAGARAA